MLFDSPIFSSSSSLSSLSVESGDTFPTLPGGTTAGFLFYLKTAVGNDEPGLYVWNGSAFIRAISESVSNLLVSGICSVADDLEVTPYGFSGLGTTIVYSEGPTDWLEHYGPAGGTFGVQKTGRWSFDATKSHRLTFKHQNLNAATNYQSVIYIGPFVVEGHRSIADYVGFRSTQGGSVNKIIGDTTRSITGIEWEFLYTPIDATSGSLTVNKDGLLYGTTTVTIDNPVTEYPTIIMVDNSDKQRVADVIVELN